MKDRVSRYPGRVKLVPVAGEANTYDVERADGPVEEGTPLNKKSLLQDATAALAGLGIEATPDDVLTKILTHLLKLQTVVIPSSGWEGSANGEGPFRQTVTVPYVSAVEEDQGIFPTPSHSSRAEWERIQAQAVAQSTNRLTFETQERTYDDLTVHVLIMEVL